MKKLRVVWLTVVRLVKQIIALPEIVANATRQRRRQAVINDNEVERLDRIRNPSKYLGK